jgi:hypothetical protein
MIKKDKQRRSEMILELNRAYKIIVDFINPNQLRICAAFIQNSYEEILLFIN